jgi:hypothetical protein
VARIGAIVTSVVAEEWPSLAEQLRQFVLVTEVVSVSALGIAAAMLVPCQLGASASTDCRGESRADVERGLDPNDQGR